MINGGGGGIGYTCFVCIIKVFVFCLTFKLFVYLVSNFVAYPLFISLNYIMLGDDRYRYCM